MREAPPEKAGLSFVCGAAFQFYGKDLRKSKPY
jgi:hypothetical protein